MHFSTLAALPALLAASTASAAVIDVAIGQGGLMYQPDSVMASMGDIIRFNWVTSIPHNVNSGDYSKPCQADNMVVSPTMEGSNATMTWDMEVTSTAPMYLFCSVGQHCVEGMAMVINPSNSSGQSLAGYQSAAKTATKMVATASDVGGVLAASSATALPTGGSMMSASASMMSASGSMMSASGSMAATSTMTVMPASTAASAASSAASAAKTGAAGSNKAGAGVAFGAAVAGLVIAL